MNRHYLRAVPTDPINESALAWEIVPPSDGSKGAVFDVRSTAPGQTRDGRSYREF